ncbi:hypothetical protein RchiOBHm_Chr6g0245781 [Rosa chinensis]|uniref:Uncharacterized protein n=1 Tax=Rosa chinensis TaxID=74649 RepID=A0A2P6PJD4_ROSCH|nr:hypothetical protein RchiOBHm_Chr6g0245781 [Rosa chinensis]
MVYIYFLVLSVVKYRRQLPKLFCRYIFGALIIAKLLSVPIVMSYHTHVFM